MTREDVRKSRINDALVSTSFIVRALHTFLSFRVFDRDKVIRKH